MTNTQVKQHNWVHIYLYVYIPLLSQLWLGGNTCFHCYSPVQAYIWALHTPMYIFCMHICEFARIRENFHGQLASVYKIGAIKYVNFIQTQSKTHSPSVYSSFSQWKRNVELTLSRLRALGWENTWTASKQTTINKLKQGNKLNWNPMVNECCTSGPEVHVVPLLLLRANHISSLYKSWLARELK